MAKTLQELYDYIQTEPEIRSLINETVKYLKAEWPPEGSTIQTVYSVKKILTNAQIKTLPSTPVHLIDAPGAGKVIVGLGGLISVASQAGAYTNIAFSGGPGAVLDLIIGNNSNNIFGYAPMALVYAALNGAAPLTKIPLVQIAGSYAASDVEVTTGRVSEGDSKSINVNQFLENQAVSISIWNSPDDNTDAGDFTGGSDDNYMKINLLYTILDL